MAMQSGITLYKIFLMVGAGYTGTILMKNGKLSDVFAELQKSLKRTDGDTDNSDDIATQIRRLAMDIRQLASSRQVTVLNGNSEQNNLTSLVIPTATLGALGYCYLWWKGLSFSDLMYVTKHSMAKAVTNLTKHLDHVSEALAAAKRHLTQRIENLDGKLDEQVEISRLLRTEVSGARDDISHIGFDLDELQRMVSCLDGKLLSIEEKQELTNMGLVYLCCLADGEKVKMPQELQGQLNHLRIAGYSASMGLKAIVDSLSPEKPLLPDRGSQDDTVLSRKSLLRSASIKC